MTRNKILTIIAVAAVAAMFVASGMLLAEEKAMTGGDQMPEMGAPEQMKQVAGMVGNYEVTGKYKMDPASDWIEFTGTAEYSMTLDGAALMMHFHSEMMGMPFAGMGVLCYSREYKQWQNMWIDNMGGAMSIYTGDMKDGKMVLTGTEKWQGQEYQAKTTTSNMTDKGFDWNYEISTDGGKTYVPSMEMHYTKKM